MAGRWGGGGGLLGGDGGLVLTHMMRKTIDFFFFFFSVHCIMTSMVKTSYHQIGISEALQDK